VLLTGSREAGEDLLQEGLMRLLRHWPRIDGDPEGYLRRTLYNLAIDGWRRERSWRERLRMLPPAVSGGSDDTATVDLRDALVRLLFQLPPRQRSLIVLRYWETPPGGGNSSMT
jgi:RNA polymerase sigma factor (sigma-70 family)